MNLYRERAEQLVVALNLPVVGDLIAREKYVAFIERALREVAAEVLDAEAESYAAMGALQIGCINVAGGLRHHARRIEEGGEG